MKINTLTLYSGVDIPMSTAPIVIHQPTIKEIGYLGESVFFQSLQVLLADKNNYNINKNVINNTTNFQILLEIINTQLDDFIQIRNNVSLLLALLFNKYQVDLRKDTIALISNNSSEYLFNEKNYNEFCDILRQVFNLEDKKVSVAPDKATQKIFKKLEERHKKLAKIKPLSEKEKEESQLTKIVSIVSLGLGVDSIVLKSNVLFKLRENRYTRANT